MTSINAMRLNQHEGLMVCDEARYWNPEWMIFYTPEKIRSVVADEVRSERQVVAFMGQTGTSSIGDEWLSEIRRAITRRVLGTQDAGSVPSIVTLDTLARIAFEEITHIKKAHIDDFLRARFGFDSRAVITGAYTDADGVEITISDKDLIRNALKYMTFEGAPEEVKGIFGNSQILAGYHPDDGFRIFYMTERWPVCEEVQEIFIAQGSGRDTCDLVYSRYADHQPLSARRHMREINRSDALMTMLRGVNTAMAQTAGVGGYPKIIWINGRKPASDWVLEISDMRSRLAAEIVTAVDHRLIDPEIGRDLVDALIFENADFIGINERLFASATSGAALFRFLRRYK